MKKKLSRILGVVAVIALLASFMVPVAADVSEPIVTLDDETISATTTYSVSFKLGEELWTTGYTLNDSGGTATAEWSDAQKHSGSDSVYLSVPTVDDYAEVYFPVNIKLGDIDLATTYFWVKNVSGSNIPYFKFELENGVGLNDDAADSANFQEWAQHLATASPEWQNYNLDDYTTNWTGNAWNTWADTVAYYGGETLVVCIVVENADFVMSNYVDDISISDYTYSMEESLAEPTSATITITFPEDTTVPEDSPAGTIQASPGWIRGQWKNATTSGVTFLSNKEELTVIATLGASDEIGEGATVRIQVPGITNPDEAGDYTLEVETSVEEDLVESETYEIEVPDVDVLPGVVELYNPSDVLMDSYHSVQEALDDADEGWSILIGEGLYDEDLDTVEAEADVTIEGSGDIEDIIIEGTWTITKEDITIDSITLDGDEANFVLIVAADDFTLQNCVLEDADVALIGVNAGIEDHPTVIDDCTFNIEDETGILVGGVTEISDSTFTIEEDGEGIGIDIDADISVTDCTFNGGSGVGVEVNSGSDDSAIEGCTFDGLLKAFVIIDGTVDIFGGTIQNCEEEAIIVEDAVLVTIHNNTITGNDEAVILFVEDAAANVFMMFNDITDNAGDDDLLIDNDTSVDLFVSNNWWGDPDGPGDDAFSDYVESEPFLPGPIENSAIETGVDYGETADFEDVCGVTVRSTAGGQDLDLLAIVGAAQYTENPVDAIDDAVGFWDVCVIDPDVAITEITVRLYTDVTDETEVHVWGEARGEWLKSDVATPNLFSGFIAVKITDTSTPTIGDLEALPFVVVEPPEGTEDIEEITAPEIGAVDVSVTPTLAWTAVDDATYEIQIAQDDSFAKFALDVVATSTTSAYIVKTVLAEGTSYYWRVRAVTDAGAGDWVTGVFTTATPEAEPTPPITIEKTEPPEITVTMPPATITTAIDPGLLWAIIGVGAVLVIALIVLIVRTRRAI